MKVYRVYTGRSRAGESQWRQFGTLDAARAACDEMFAADGVARLIFEREGSEVGEIGFHHAPPVLLGAK